VTNRGKWIVLNKRKSVSK